MSRRTARSTGTASSGPPTGTPTQPMRKASAACDAARHRGSVDKGRHDVRAYGSRLYGPVPRDEGTAHRPRRSARPQLRPGRRASLRRRKGGDEKNIPSCPARRYPASVTRRPILFVNPMHTHGFSGWSERPRGSLSEQLAGAFRRSRNSSITIPGGRRSGDLDERATMHRGAGTMRPISAASCCALSSTRTDPTRRDEIPPEASLPDYAIRLHLIAACCLLAAATAQAQLAPRELRSSPAQPARPQMPRVVAPVFPTGPAPGLCQWHLRSHPAEHALPRRTCRLPVGMRARPITASSRCGVLLPAGAGRSNSTREPVVTQQRLTQ